MISRKIFVILFLVVVACCKPSNKVALITHHDISVTLNPVDHSIKGTDKVTAAFPKGVTEIGFLLNRTLTKVSLVNDPNLTLIESHVLQFSEDYKKSVDETEKKLYRYFIVKTDEATPELEFTLSFEGVIFDSLHTLEQEYSRGFATTSGLIEERGVYLAGYTGWIPTQKQGMFTYRLKTSLPLGWQSISQGKEITRGAEGEYQVDEWICDKPMEEIYLIAGKYLITEEDHNGIKVMTYFYQNEPELAERYRSATKRYIDMYSQQIGPYPFEKFALVENFWPTGYGMPSFTLLGSQIIRLPFIIHTSYGHEILHNWWGNGVFVDWQNGNWCEGLTSYMADHYYKQLSGQAVSYRRSMLQNYLNYVNEGKDFPLKEFTERHNPASQAVGYNKSAMIYHMLFIMLGEEKFYNAVRSFYQNNLFKTASWKDVESEFAAQTESGDLSWYFDLWVNRKGAPILKIEKATITKAETHYSIELTLSQSAPVYRLQVPVYFEGESDTTVYVDLQKQQQTYNFQFKKSPKKVWVDPQFDIFRKLDRSEIPPALSQTFGAEKTLIILPSQVDLQVYKEYEKLAQSWKGSETVEIKPDNEVDEQYLKDKALWILGSQNLWYAKYVKSLPHQAQISDRSWKIDQNEFSKENHTLVLATQHPFNPELSWSLIDTDDMKSLLSLSRKLPHYGKYGYLVFNGDLNVLKGEWSVENSPLIMELTLTQVEQ